MSRHIFRINDPNELILATAIHAGHAMDTALLNCTGLSSSERLYEEDPFTDVWTYEFENNVVVDRSRFEVDLNRSRDKAIYLTPDDAWGLHVWDAPLSADCINKLRARYDEFYLKLKEVVQGLTQRGQLIVLDLHSYNHRRGDALAPQETNPDINVGTGTMSERSRWEHLIDAAMETMRNTKINGAYLDVRENVKFKGGHMALWLHDRFPENVCVLSIEMKKFFMDEHTGEPDDRTITDLSAMFRSVRSTILDLLSLNAPIELPTNVGKLNAI